MVKYNFPTSISFTGTTFSWNICQNDESRKVILVAGGVFLSMFVKTVILICTTKFISWMSVCHWKHSLFVAIFFSGWEFDVKKGSVKHFKLDNLEFPLSWNRFPLFHWVIFFVSKRKWVSKKIGSKTVVYNNGSQFVYKWPLPWEWYSLKAQRGQRNATHSSSIHSSQLFVQSSFER